MRKLITLMFASVILGLGGILFAAEAPVYDGEGAENATVVQLNKKTMIGYSHEKWGDYFWVYNLTEDEELPVSIYLYDGKKKEWKLVGDVTVKGFGKDENIETEFQHKFDKYEYYAIVAKNGKKYDAVGRRKFQSMGFFKNHITVLNVFSTEPTPEDVKKAAFVFNNSEVSGKFRDVVKFTNKSNDANMNFYLYGFNDENDACWKKLGISDLKGNGDSDTMDINTFKYLAILPDNGKIYEYEIKKKSNDLLITVK